jgi:hypothetical protein
MALVIQHAKCMHRIVCGRIIFFQYYLLNVVIFEKKKNCY